ncbi:hypothetical protein [Bacillus paramycoides]|uniref:hypothetical protein n=1 Tax=Bacillus paramycoides TaxID=2026194 RepID=UPI002E1BB338|nr:hypothetical protein [Bacillus paramycoides]
MLSIEGVCDYFFKRVELVNKIFNGDICLGIQAYSYGENFLEKEKEWRGIEYTEEFSQR